MKRFNALKIIGTVVAVLIGFLVPGFSELPFEVLMILGGVVLLSLVFGAAFLAMAVSKIRKKRRKKSDEISDDSHKFPGYGVAGVLSHLSCPEAFPAGVDGSERCVRQLQKQSCDGLFADQFPCKVSAEKDGVFGKTGIRIRFADQLPAADFRELFQILVRICGEPDFYEEYFGFRWERPDLVLRFGFVSVNYNYEVPMIILSPRCRRGAAVPYGEYRSYNELFARHGLLLGRFGYTEWWKEYGYSFGYPGRFLFGHLKNGVLSWSVRDGGTGAAAVEERKVSSPEAVEAILVEILKS